MASIKEIFDRLTPDEKARLNYSFEYGISQFVKLENGRYIGVNTQHVAFLQPESVSGKWSIGHVKSNGR